MKTYIYERTDKTIEEMMKEKKDLLQNAGIYTRIDKNFVHVFDKEIEISSRHAKLIYDKSTEPLMLDIYISDSFYKTGENYIGIYDLYGLMYRKDRLFNSLYFIKKTYDYNTYFTAQFYIDMNKSIYHFNKIPNDAIISEATKERFKDFLPKEKLKETETITFEEFMNYIGFPLLKLKNPDFK